MSAKLSDVPAGGPHQPAQDHSLPAGCGVDCARAQQAMVSYPPRRTCNPAAVHQPSGCLLDSSKRLLDHTRRPTPTPPWPPPTPPRPTPPPLPTSGATPPPPPAAEVSAATHPSTPHRSQRGAAPRGLYPSISCRRGGRALSSCLASCVGVGVGSWWAGVGGAGVLTVVSRGVVVVPWS